MLQSVGSQGAGHDSATEVQEQQCIGVNDSLLEDLFAYLVLLTLRLRCCSLAFSRFGEQGSSPGVCGFLIATAALVGVHRLLRLGLWGLPGLGIDCVPCLGRWILICWTHSRVHESFLEECSLHG